LRAALSDDDAAMMHATEAFQAAFTEADELGGVAFGQTGPSDSAESKAPADEAESPAARTS